MDKIFTHRMIHQALDQNLTDRVLVHYISYNDYLASFTGKKVHQLNVVFTSQDPGAVRSSRAETIVWYPVPSPLRLNRTR